VVVIAAIVAFTWYKISTHRSTQTNETGGVPTEDKNPRVTIGEEQAQGPRVSLRYPDELAPPASGNVQGDY